MPCPRRVSAIGSGVGLSRRAQVVPGRARGDDQHVEPRLRELRCSRRCVAVARRRERQRPSTSARTSFTRAPPSLVSGRRVMSTRAGQAGRLPQCPACRRCRAARAGPVRRLRGNFTRQVRSVSTSDVVSTSAPQTTCRLLIQTCAAAQDRQRAERDLDGDERQQERAGTRQLARAADGDTRRVRPSRRPRASRPTAPDPMGEMNRDLRVPVVGHQSAEHQREVGNRQPRVRVPHRGAHEDLRVDRARWSPRPAAQHGVI